ncbi:hypothetical protein FCOIX_7165 [Fusarium coicis]|nr:hypothetical protein FCOIX_7165 [Fusarium coicis]
MTNSQLRRDQDDGGDPECLQRTQSRRGQLPAGRWLWTTDLSVAKPVADSNNRREIQHRPRRAWARDDLGIRRPQEHAVDSKRLAKAPCKSREAKRFPSKSSPSSPWDQEQLVEEVKSIYAGLVMVESKCIEVDKAQSTEGRLTHEEWQQLIALHRKLLLEDDDPFNISSTKGSQICALGELLSELSPGSRGFCRLNSRLLPLLQVKKGAPSCVRFAEFMILIGALSDILSKYSSLLDFTDTLLIGLFDLITSIITRLNMRFRSAYEELKCRNASTQIIFEFPNNMRHVCTTMPWTILPALLVLWGVCWMFILSPSDLEPEKFKAPVPTFSPAPAAYDFFDNSGQAYYDFGLQSFFMPETSTAGFEHPTIDSLPFDNDGAGVDPIYLVQAAPQDPVFLSFDVLPRNSAGITETSSKEGLTEALPAAVTPDSILQSYGATNSQEPFNATVNVASVDQGVQNTGHLRICNHDPKVLTSSAESDGTEEQSVSHPVLTPALPAEPLSEGSSGESSVRKRSRFENDDEENGDDWSEESLLREMKKKLKRMAQEVKEKEDAYLRAREGLESIQKTIQVMEDSLRKS